MSSPPTAEGRLAADVVDLGRPFSAHELDAVRVAFDRVVAGGQPSEYARIALDGAGEPAFAAALDVLGPLVAACAGRPVGVFQDTLIAKAAHGAPLPLHQDAAYWPLQPLDGLTTWLALDDADEADGCLHHVPGTWSLGERRPLFGLTGDDDPRARLPALDAGAPSVATPAAAGTVLAHHPMTWHGSYANTSGRPRRAWSVFWIHPGATWDPAHSPHPATAVDPPAPGAPYEPPRWYEPSSTTTVREPPSGTRSGAGRGRVSTGGAEADQPTLPQKRLPGASGSS